MSLPTALATTCLYPYCPRSPPTFLGAADREGRSTLAAPQPTRRTADLDERCGTGRLLPNCVSLAASSPTNSAVNRLPQLPSLLTTFMPVPFASRTLVSAPTYTSVCVSSDRCRRAKRKSVFV